MKTPKENEISKINKIVENIYSKKKLTSLQKKNYIEKLHEHSCWQPLVDLLEEVALKSKNQPEKEEAYFLWAVVQLREFQNLGDATRTLCQMIESLKLDFSTFLGRLQADSHFKDNYSVQAAVLEKGYLSFTRKSEKIKALEYLCLIFKKRTHKNLKLQFYVGELLKLEPYNGEALRYKVEELAQEKRWEDVVGLYRECLDETKEKKKKYLRALELAGQL